jgi:hypothetical protein
VGLESRWGGAIVEVSRNGTNLVNSFDTGRQVQLSFYDGRHYAPCGDCEGAKGWNPVQGGDYHKHGSPVLARTIGTDSIYIKTQPHQWFPDNKGGGSGQAVLSDLVVEQWVSLVSKYNFAVKVHYKVTHIGSDIHVNSYQEIPAVYINSEFDRFVYYGGTSPWINESVTILTDIPHRPKTTPDLYNPELWAAFVNKQNFGLTVYTPGQFPYVVATLIPHPNLGAGTNYFLQRTYYTFGPDTVLEGDYYLFAGDYHDARKAIYDLRSTTAALDVATPRGWLDQPTADSSLKGVTTVTGWAFDNVRVQAVNVSLDGKKIGTASYGFPRTDVPKKMAYAPINIGYSYRLDTIKFSNGPHMLIVEARDTNGNVAIFPPIQISIDN